MTCCTTATSTFCAAPNSLATTLLLRFRDDWEGKFDFLKDLCQVVYLPRTPEISTTQIKHDLGLAEAVDGVDQLPETEADKAKK